MIDLKKLRESEGHVLAIVNTQTGEYEPVSDAVTRIIRCKECVKYQTEDCAMQYTSEDGQYNFMWAEPNDYCSWGERKVDTVITCKECKWYNSERFLCNNNESFPWKNDDFCSMAERKADD